MPAGTPVLLGKTTTADTSTDQTVTLSRALAAYERAIVFVEMRRNDSTDPVEPTVSGLGVTFGAAKKSYGQKTSGTDRLAMFGWESTSVGSPSGTTLTVALGSVTYTHVKIYVVAVTDVYAAGTSIVQSVNGGQNGSGDIECQMATMTDTTNNLFLMFGQAQGTNPSTWTTISPAGMAELASTDETLADSTGKDVSGHIQYDVGNSVVNPKIQSRASTTCDSLGGIAFELAYGAAPAGGGSESVTDGFILGDSVIAGISSHLADGFKLGEDIGTILTIDSGAEGIKWGDSVVAQIHTYNTITDGFKLGESILQESLFSKFPQDGFILGDSVGLSVALKLAIIDGFRLSDFVSERHSAGSPLTNLIDLSNLTGIN